MDATERKETTFDRLLEAYAPKASEFDIVLEKGDTLRFRHPSSSDELGKLAQSAVTFATEGLAPGKCLDSWKPYIPENKAVAAKAYYIAALSVAPKLSQFDCLKMAKVAPMLFDAIYGLVSQATEVRGAIREAAEVEELGKS